MFDESIDPILDIETSNHKPDVLDPIDAFSIRCKAHLVGWKVLQDGNQFFWVLISLFPSPYASVGWQVGEISLCNAFQVMNPACKTNDVFLYAKCHPT
jgi:hypothetical protein